MGQFGAKNGTLKNTEKFQFFLPHQGKILIFLTRLGNNFQFSSLGKYFQFFAPFGEKFSFLPC
jgi:hypothetical protein